MATSKPTREMSKAERSFDWLALGIGVIGLLHFLTALVPGVATWSVDYWSTFPLWGQSALLLLIAVVVLPGVSERIASVVERQRWSRVTVGAALAVALAAFLLLRSRGFSYGDGYSFRSYFVGGQVPEVGGNLALMAGDLLVHWVVYRFAVMPFGGSVEIAYAILSALAGIASLVAIERIAELIYPKDRGARWTLIAAGFSSGAAVLWFGHVEAYSLVGATLLWSLYFLISGRAIAAWLAWVVACGFHMSAVAFLPVLLWSTWGKRFFAEMSLSKTVWLFLAGLIGWGIAALVVGLVKPGIFVPIVATADSTYTAFSLAHILDSCNLLLFAAPLGLIGVAFWLVRGEPSRPGSDAQALAILAVATASLWYFAFWVDPLLGAFRDWDLLGLFGIPFSLLGAILVLRRTPSLGGIRPQWVVISALAIAHTGAFVLTVQDEIKPMERVDRLVREDVHYSRDFHRGERLMSWAFIVTEILDRKDLGIVHLRKRSEWEPTDYKSWGNLGSLYWKTGQYDSSIVSFEAALKLHPADEPKTLEQLAFAYAGAKDWTGASRTVQKLALSRELKIEELNLLAFSMLTMGDDAGADSILDRSLAKDPNQQEAFYYRGIVYERMADTTAALESYERAMLPQTNVEDVYLRCARLYQAQKRWADAERVATAWQGQFPQSPTPSFFAGICRIATQQYAGAKEALERSASIDPNHALTQFYLATAYRNLGERDRALAAARRAASLDTTLAIPYLEIVYVAVDSGNRALAVEATHEYLKRSPGDSGMSYLQQFLEP